MRSVKLINYNTFCSMFFTAAKNIYITKEGCIMFLRTTLFIREQKFFDKLFPYIFVILFFISIFNLGCKQTSEKSGIVVIGPNITEIIFAIGANTLLKGIGDFDDYPPETANIPKIGSYLSPNLEKITTLRPSIIITSGEIPQLREFAEHSEIQYYTVPMDTFPQIYEGIIKIGEITHHTRQAKVLLEEMKGNIQKIQNLTSGLEPLPTLLVVGRELRDLSSVQVAGGKSFLSEILKIAGGINVFEDAEQPYFEVSAEQIIAKAPEAIVEFRCGENLTQRQLDALFLDWKALETVPAVSKSRIFFILESYGMRPGPRIYKVAEKIATSLHPDVKLGL